MKMRYFDFETLHINNIPSSSVNFYFKKDEVHTYACVSSTANNIARRKCWKYFFSRDLHFFRQADCYLKTVKNEGDNGFNTSRLLAMRGPVYHSAGITNSPWPPLSEQR